VFLKIQNPNGIQIHMWGKELKSIRVLLFGVIVGIMAVLFISIPVSVYSMSSRPPVIPEWLEDGDYLQESYLDNRKILIKDKKSNVKGYLQRSYIDQRKMLIFDKDGKVKGYLQRDPMDSRKLKFVKE
jgi:hypothetical protein